MVDRTAGQKDGDTVGLTGEKKAALKVGKMVVLLVDGLVVCLALIQDFLRAKLMETFVVEAMGGIKVVSWDWLYAGEQDAKWAIPKDIEQENLMVLCAADGRAAVMAELQDSSSAAEKEHELVEQLVEMTDAGKVVSMDEKLDSEQVAPQDICAVDYLELLLDDKKDELTGNEWVATTVEKMDVTSGDSPTVQSGRLLDQMMVYAKVTWME